MVILSNAPTFHKLWNAPWVYDDCESISCPCPISLIVFKAHMNILFIVKAKILVIIRAPITMVTIEPKMVNIYWAWTSISLEHFPFWCPILHPRGSNIGVWLDKTTMKSPLTLPMNHDDVIELLISSHVTAASRVIKEAMLPYYGHFQLHIQFWLLDRTGNSYNILVVVDVLRL